MARHTEFIFIAAIIFSSLSFKALSQATVAFYNCENLFDTLDDPRKEDEEFTPRGKYRYTAWVYRAKIRNIAAVIGSMDGGRGPAVAGLAEVENNTVLNDVARDRAVAAIGYRNVWISGPDPRGINVALLYDPKRFRVIRSESVGVNLAGTGGKAVTRDVLYVKGILLGDTVHLFVNHWPSRRGGPEASEGKRSMAAATVKRKIDELQRREAGARVIVMGDLNDNPTDASITTVLGAGCEPAREVSRLYNPYCELYRRGQGTEVHQRNWNLFDQVIISGNLVQGGRNRLRYERAEIYKPDFIVDHYRGYEGQPHRSFKGTKWINGYSDHFPVILYLRKQ